MAFENEEKKLHDALVSCKVPDIAKAVEEAHAAGMTANAIIDCLGNSMSEVGVLFERGKLFLPHVLSAANGMKKAMDDLGPELAAGGETGEAKASVVMGTVEGDVHDIGKSICSTMLQCAGFEVHDLGRDVPKGNFINEVQNGCTFCGTQGQGHRHGRRSPCHTGLRRQDRSRHLRRVRFRDHQESEGPRCLIKLQK